MKTINLTVAILLAIKNFDTTPFSVANITTQLRGDVNDGEYSIEDYEDNNIEHNEVRKTFVNLLENGFLDEYDIDYNTNTYIPYRLFTKKTVAKLPTMKLHLPPTNPFWSTATVNMSAVQTLTPIPAQPSDQIKNTKTLPPQAAGTFGVPTSARPNPQPTKATIGGVYGTFGISTPTKPLVNVTKISQGDQAKILFFIRGKGQVTTKRIQSTLKRYTCADIKEFLEERKLLAPLAKTLDASKAYTIVL